jgi:cell division protein FtsB
MSLVVDLKRRARMAVPPVVFLSLVAYFLWQAQLGPRGLNTWAQRQTDLKVAQQDYAMAQQEVAAWERRVRSMRSDRLDRDTLDERTRALLNLSDSNDIIVMYAPGQQLY